MINDQVFEQGGYDDDDDDDFGGPDDEPEEEWEVGAPRRVRRRRGTPKAKRALRARSRRRRRPAARQHKREAKAVARHQLPPMILQGVTLSTPPWAEGDSIPAQDVVQAMKRAEAAFPYTSLFTSGTSVGSDLALSLNSPTAGTAIVAVALKITISASLTTMVPNLPVQLTWTVTATEAMRDGAPTGLGTVQMFLPNRVKAAQMVAFAYGIVNSKLYLQPWMMTNAFRPIGVMTGAEATDPIIATLAGLPSGYSAQLQLLTRASPEGKNLHAYAARVAG